jgi:co-chaperonin GroES (HSP10)
MIALLNSYIALDGIGSFSGNEKVMKGTVRLVGVGVEGISVGDVVFYKRSDAMEVMYNNKEYVAIQSDKVIGKI